MSKFYFCLFLLIFGSLNLSLVKAQSFGDLGIEYQFMGANSKLPWWMHVNKGGAVDPTSANALTNVSYADKIDFKSDLSFQYGADVIVRASEHKTAVFRQAYVKTHYSNYELAFGRYYDPIGLSETFMGDLGMGSMMVSKNAIPVPKIGFKTTGFLRVPLTFNLFRWSASFAHGWLGGNRNVKDAYLHQKTFYLNLNLWAFQGYGGLVHNAVWGGVSPIYGKLPQSFSDYLTIVTGISPNNSKRVIPGENDNVFGNSVAAYDFGFTLTLKALVFKAYRLFYHEDTVSLRFRNAWDGVWGGSFEFTKPLFGIKSIGHEFMYLVRQGQLRDGSVIEPPGADNAYNNFMYSTGWTHYGRVIGNPLILMNPGTDSPYFYPNTMPITNNIIIAHHSFINATLGDVDYTLHFIYSKNHGTVQDLYELGEPYDIKRIRKEEFYVTLKTIYSLKKELNLDFIAEFSADLGKLYSNRYGLMLGLRLNIPTNARFSEKN